jgi:hypothetical protein
MRRIVVVSAALALLFVTAGCLLNRYSSDPNQRIAQLQPTPTRTSDPGPVPQPVLPSRFGTDAPTATPSPATSDPLELRKALAEKKARLHETRAQFYKLEAQRYAVQKTLRDLEGQIAADEKGLGEALKDKQTRGEGGPKRKAVGEKSQEQQPEKAPPTGQQGATAPPLSSRLWGAVDRVQSFLGVHVINGYSSDPNTRIGELLNNSEDLRQIEYEWERIWFTDQPAHLKPERVDGGARP